MDVRDHIKLEIANLQQQITELKSQGAFLSNVRVERTAAGGTASQRSQAECKYARLRAGKGKLLDNGKKSRYIPIHEIDKYQTMCNRGKAISKLDKEVQKRQKKLKRLDIVAVELGL